MKSNEPRILDPAQAHGRLAARTSGVKPAREIDEDARVARDLTEVAPVNRPIITGSTTDGTGLRSLVDALAALGFVVNGLDDD